MKTQIILLISCLLLTFNTYAGDIPDPPPNVTVNIADLAAGEKRVVVWGRTQVWIVKRTPADIQSLEGNLLRGAPQGKYWRSQFINAYDLNPLLPNVLELDQLPLEQYEYRSYRQDIFVLLPISPYSGCLLTHKPDYLKHLNTVGYVDTCRKHLYDHAGRIFPHPNLGAYWNLYIPPHQFIDDTTLLIGVGEPPRKLSATSYAPKIDYAALKPKARLLEAAKRGELEIVKQTLAAGVGVESALYHGVRPLLLAAARGHQDIVELLLEHGADINAPNVEGYSSIYAAIAAHKLDMVEFLAIKGANIHAICTHPDCQGTPLNFAIYWSLQEADSQAAVKILLKHGADPMRTYGGKNALDLAKEKNNLGVLEMLEQSVSSDLKK